MQRSYPLRWLSLALGLGFLAIQCQESLSDDCSKTLTCPGTEVPKLDRNCNWVYPSTGKIWTEGPSYDPAAKVWRWPDGKETATQTLDCDLTIGDAGADATPGLSCRSTADCDVPLVCNTLTSACVECLSHEDCADNTAVGDAGAAIACDVVRHECVPCVDDDNCSGDTPVCKTDATNSSNNECVQCTKDAECGGEKSICDLSSNECTSRCTTSAQCSGEKSVCNVTTQLCVECTDNSTCSGDSATQCSTASNECVECIDDAPCIGSGRVCDVTSNNCVQCTGDSQCVNVPNASRCDTETNLCVQCLNDAECTEAASSRCNPVSHLCVGCTEDSQCEGGNRCNTEQGGICRQCITSADCPSLAPVCETTQGQCVECLTNAECPLPDAARCETEGTDRHTCVGCEGNGDCGGVNDNRGLPGLCSPFTATCVNCYQNGDCLTATLARCGNGGECAICLQDSDCGGRFGGLEGCVPNQGCVECTNDTHCSDTSQTPVCKLNNTGESQGTAAVNTCVECASDADCPNANAARCLDNQCVACQANDDCTHLDPNGATTAGGTGVCDTGVCVECTAANRTACGTNVCNSLTKQCTTFPVGSAGLCETCVSDAHCDATQRCATQLFGATTLGPFCFPVGTGDGTACNLTPYSAPTSATTVDGATASLCLLRRTTCAGLGDVSVQDCSADADCGATGLDDGRCDDTTGTCSIPCTSNVDCFDPDQNSCLGGVCQL